ncbi:hypothetical protein BDV36DRAFT_266287 [Aspergillus pseudocaelatus]|uniref:Uncharacterized protein n=1 Tax=Aspergillus pseudocaelatus TaxID=1825620 RepID=A0ABQ6WAF3_9EURO|nr:hypothetical protein BDV36DRAFT_266287 [Aspergillus pseudocaelatus]
MDLRELHMEKKSQSLYVTFSAGLVYFTPICFNNPLHISFSWKEMMNDASRPLFSLRQLFSSPYLFHFFVLSFSLLPVHLS